MRMRNHDSSNRDYRYGGGQCVWRSKKGRECINQDENKGFCTRMMDFSMRAILICKNAIRCPTALNSHTM